MSDAGGTIAERFESSCKIFENRFSELSKKLQSLGDFTSEIVWEGDLAVNLNIKGTNLYPDSAIQWTEGQLRGRSDTMERILFTTSTHCNLAGSPGKLMEECQKFFGEKSIDASRIPLQEIEFCFIFGLGLGHHIQELLSSSEFSTFVIIEPVAEFITHSMKVVDWEAVFKVVDANGARVLFVTDDTPEKAVRHIEAIVSHYGNMFLDGSLLYAHIIHGL